MPPKEVVDEVTALSKDLSKEYATLFQLDGVNFHAHITIYSPEYPENNRSKVLSVVEKIASQNSRINFHLNNINADKGFITLEFVHSIEVSSLHQKVVEGLNTLREGRMSEKNTSDYMRSLDLERQRNLEKYGRTNVINLYHLHLSVTRLQDEVLAKTVSSNIKWKINRFTVDKIGVYTMGPNGTCTKLIKEFCLN